MRTWLLTIVVASLLTGCTRKVPPRPFSEPVVKKNPIAKIEIQRRLVGETEDSFWVALVLGEADLSDRIYGQVASLEKFTGSHPPELVLLQGWVYAVGDSPSVGTDLISAEAESSRLVLQKVVAGGQEPRNCDRLICIEASAGKRINVFNRETDALLAQVSPGQFVDIYPNPSGGLVVDGPKNWTESITEFVTGKVRRTRVKQHVP